MDLSIFECKITFLAHKYYSVGEREKRKKSIVVGMHQMYRQLPTDIHIYVHMCNMLMNSSIIIRSVICSGLLLGSLAEQICIVRLNYSLLI